MLTQNATLHHMIEQLQHFLSSINDRASVELLDKAIEKATADKAYALKIQDAFLRGSTIEVRDLLSDFGEYCPIFPNPDICFSERMEYMSAVNFIDSALYHIKRDETEEVLSWWTN